MKTPQLLVLVRHTESKFNAARPEGLRFLPDEKSRERMGQMPDHQVDVTEAGQLMCPLLGRYLRNRFGTFDAAFYSGYTRTEKTLFGALGAYDEAERSKIAIKRDILLRERDSGYTYTMLEREVQELFPWYADYWKKTGSFFARPIGGESVADVSDRLRIFRDELHRDWAGKRLLAVIHGRTLAAFRFLLEEWSPEEAEHFLKGPSPRNCGITVYENDSVSDKLALKEYDTLPTEPS